MRTRWALYMHIPCVRDCQRFICVFLLAALAASTRLVAADPYRHDASGFECPDELAGLTRVRVDNYENEHPGLGIACKYRLLGDLFADVYIYTAGLKVVPSDVTHPSMSALRAQTVKEIEEFAQSRGEHVRKLNEAIIQVDTGGGPISVFYNSFVITSTNGAARNTWLWLWTARKHVMKIRMTRPPAGDPDPKYVREFYETVVRMATN